MSTIDTEHYPWVLVETDLRKGIPQVIAYFYSEEDAEYCAQEFNRDSGPMRCEVKKATDRV